MSVILFLNQDSFDLICFTCETSLPKPLLWYLCVYLSFALFHSPLNRRPDEKMPAEKLELSTVVSRLEKKKPLVKICQYRNCELFPGDVMRTKILYKPTGTHKVYKLNCSFDLYSRLFSPVLFLLPLSANNIQCVSQPEIRPALPHKSAVVPVWQMQPHLHSKFECVFIVYAAQETESKAG